MDLEVSVHTEFDHYAYSQAHEVVVMASLDCPKSLSKMMGDGGHAPIDLVCVLDTSGSMAGEKLQLMCASMDLVIEQLNKNDRLGIVVFDSEVSIILELQSMDAIGKANASAALQNIIAGSATNLSGGLFAGLSMLQSREITADITSVILFTDGQATRGITDDEQMVEALQTSLANLGTPCTVFTFGFGDDHDATMLRRLSDAGDGMYYYISVPAEIPAAFVDCIGGLVSVALQHVKLEIITEGNNIVISQILSSYKKTENSNDHKTMFLIGDMYLEEQKDILFKLSIPKIPEETFETPIARIKVTCCNVCMGLNRPQELTVSVDRTHPSVDDGFSPRPNPHVDNQLNRLRAAEALREGLALGQLGNLDDERACEPVMTAISRIKASTTGNSLFCKKLVSELDDVIKRIKGKGFAKGGAQILNAMMQCQEQQRCAAPGRYLEISADTIHSDSTAETNDISTGRSNGESTDRTDRSGNSDQPPTMYSTVFKRKLVQQAIGGARNLAAGGRSQFDQSDLPPAMLAFDLPNPDETSPLNLLHRHRNKNSNNRESPTNTVSSGTKSSGSDGCTPRDPLASPSFAVHGSNALESPRMILPLGGAQMQINLPQPGNDDGFRIPRGLSPRLPGGAGRVILDVPAPSNGGEVSPAAANQSQRSPLKDIQARQATSVRDQAPAVVIKSTGVGAGVGERGAVQAVPFPRHPGAGQNPAQPPRQQQPPQPQAQTGRLPSPFAHPLRDDGEVPPQIMNSPPPKSRPISIPRNPSGCGLDADHLHVAHSPGVAVFSFPGSNAMTPPTSQGLMRNLNRVRNMAGTPNLSAAKPFPPQHYQPQIGNPQQPQMQLQSPYRNNTPQRIAAVKPVENNVAAGNRFRPNSSGPMPIGAHI